MGAVNPDEIGTRQQMILQCIWDAGGETTVPDIINRLEARYQTHLTGQAVNTFMILLEQKGLVRKEGKVGRSYLYRTLISEKEFRKRELVRVRELTFGNSSSALVAAMLETDISDEEMEKIRRMIERYDHA